MSWSCHAGSDSSWSTQKHAPVGDNGVPQVPDDEVVEVNDWNSQATSDLAQLSRGLTCLSDQQLRRASLDMFKSQHVAAWSNDDVVMRQTPISIASTPESSQSSGSIVNVVSIGSQSVTDVAMCQDESLTDVAMPLEESMPDVSTARVECAVALSCQGF